MSVLQSCHNFFSNIQIIIMLILGRLSDLRGPTAGRTIPFQLGSSTSLLTKSAGRWEGLIGVPLVFLSSRDVHGPVGRRILDTTYRY